MTKSELAFRWTAEKLFRTQDQLYFWTFTFKDVFPDWYYSNIWRGFFREIQNLYAGTLKGVKVTELHVDHGIHYHALLNKRLWVNEVRRIGKKYGIGRVNVKVATEGSVDYLAKYISKQFQDGEKFHARIRRWHTVGGFPGTKVSNIEIISDLTRAIKLYQRYTMKKKIPFKLLQHMEATMKIESYDEDVLRIAIDRWEDANLWNYKRALKIREMQRGKFERLRNPSPEQHIAALEQ